MSELKQAAGRPVKAYYFAAAMAAVILLLSGWGYHVLDERLGAGTTAQVMPEIPFKYFPQLIEGWEGRDVPISETVLLAAANDDYVCRIYRNADKQMNASLYVAYTCEPRRMLGHRPEICYAGSGWTRQETKKETLRLPDGNAIEVLMHRFSKQGLAEQEIFVLNYYIISGQITADHSAFSGLKWRRLPSGCADYVAQVQISSDQAAGAYSLAEAATERILLHLPSVENKDGPL